MVPAPSAHTPSQLIRRLFVAAVPLHVVHAGEKCGAVKQVQGSLCMLQTARHTQASVPVDFFEEMADMVASANNDQLIGGGAPRVLSPNEAAHSDRPVDVGMPELAVDGWNYPRNAKPSNMLEPVVTVAPQSAAAENHHQSATHRDAEVAAAHRLNLAGRAERQYTSTATQQVQSQTEDMHSGIPDIQSGIPSLGVVEPCHGSDCQHSSFARDVSSRGGGYDAPSLVAFAQGSGLSLGGHTTTTSTPAPDHASCSPQCSWKCDSPKCDEVCAPVCKKPVCETRCGQVDLSACSMDCAEAHCSVLCPETACPSFGCPSCTTHCGEPSCKLSCPHDQGSCHTVCEEPECEWECKAPTDCPAPQCQMVCERPKACMANSFRELPPLQPGETAVRSFDAPLSLRQASTSSQGSNRVQTVQVKVATAHVAERPENADTVPTMEVPAIEVRHHYMDLPVGTTPTILGGLSYESYSGQ